MALISSVHVDSKEVWQRQAQAAWLEEFRCAKYLPCPFKKPIWRPKLDPQVDYFTRQGR
jgi:hypothetical protein